MDSWWSLGEGSGFPGTELEFSRIVCPFCDEQGNFESAFHVQKRKPNSRKALHFETLRCANCAGHVMVLWSASEYGTSLSSLYNYQVLPWPLKALAKFPDHWPAEVGRFWAQAHRSLTVENWDAAALMARSALQAALRGQGAAGANLKQEIDDLAGRGILPPIMKAWAHELRELANDAAHPAPSQQATQPNDARDIISFLDFLLDVVYNLPHRIEQYRSRPSS